MKVLQEITVPMLSVNDQSLTIQELLFKTGEKVEIGNVIAILETSKTTYTVEADSNGFIEYFCKAGDDLPINDVIAKIYDAKPADEIALAINEKFHSGENGITEKKSLKKIDHTIFSNEALRLMSQYKIDKSEFSGYDLVNGEDVRLKAEPGYKQKPKIEAKQTSTRKPIEEIDTGKVTQVKLSSNKLREIDYLTSVQSSGLISVIHMNVELEEVLPFLQLHMHYFKDSLLPIIIYETSRLLLKHPVFNAYFSNQSVCFHKHVNVGFAVDIDKGLKVVKIANTEKKSVREIEEEIIRLSGNYLDDKLLVDELTDVTFTITDLSTTNVAFFHPLINAKNSAILGISAFDKKLSRCLLSLAFDHRVTEGKQAAIFLSELKERIESFSENGLQQIKKQKAASISCHKCMKTLAEDNSDTGFVQCITNDGRQAYICQACFKGF